MKKRSSKTRRSPQDRPEPRPSKDLGWGAAFAVACVAVTGCKVAAGQEEGSRASRTKDLAVADVLAAGIVPVPGPAVKGRAHTPCPDEMAKVGEACIDRHEAHLVVAAPDGTWKAHPPNERPPEGARYVARSEAGVLPQAYISRVEASRACENAGKRLCSVDEWYRTCRGPEQATYPYGRDYDRKRCNVGKPHLLSRFFGSDPRAWGYDNHFNNPMLSTIPGFLAKTGEYAGCVNAYGVFDLVGNVQEWVADPADRRLAQKLPLRDGIRRSLGRGAGKGVFMGGFYSTTHEHGRGCNFVTAAHEIQYHDYSIGFRCCKNAE